MANARVELTDAAGHPVRVEVDHGQLAIEFRLALSVRPEMYRLVVPIDIRDRSALAAALAHHHARRGAPPPWLT